MTVSGGRQVNETVYTVGDDQEGDFEFESLRGNGMNRFREPFLKQASSRLKHFAVIMLGERHILRKSSLQVLFLNGYQLKIINLFQKIFYFITIIYFININHLTLGKIIVKTFQCIGITKAFMSEKNSSSNML